MALQAQRLAKCCEIPERKAVAMRQPLNKAVETARRRNLFKNVVFQPAMLIPNCGDLAAIVGAMTSFHESVNGVMGGLCRLEP